MENALVQCTAPSPSEKSARARSPGGQRGLVVSSTLPAKVTLASEGFSTVPWWLWGGSCPVLMLPKALATGVGGSCS